MRDAWRFGRFAVSLYAQHHTRYALSIQDRNGYVSQKGGNGLTVRREYVFREVLYKWRTGVYSV